MLTGQNAHFECLSYGFTKWNFSEGPLPRNTYINSNNLFIQEASYYNSGIYECHGNTDTVFDSGEPIYFNSRATLLVSE